MRNNDVLAELNPAHVWDCYECGRENFQRSVSYVMSAEETKQQLLAMGEIDEFEEVHDGDGLRVMSAPNYVTCQHCGTEFKTHIDPDEVVELEDGE